MVIVKKEDVVVFEVVLGDDVMLIGEVINSYWF